MRRLGAAALGFLFTVIPSILSGQHGLREIRRDGGGGSFGVDFVVAEPLRDFRQYGDVAAGLALGGVTGGKGLSLRIDGSFMVYDYDNREYGLTTISQIATLSAGPQLTLGSGSLRLYGFATIGGSLFWSTANYDDCACRDSGIFLDGDLTRMTSVGAGLMLGLSRRVGINLGVREMRHDDVQYVPTGGFTPNSDGTYTVDRVETPVLQRVYQAGLSIGLR
jgi:hypothetical protein